MADPVTQAPSFAGNCFAGLRPGGKHVTGFSGRFALLQIQFLCHLKGKREIWREKQGVIYFMYHSGIPPLVAGATTFPHFVVGLWVLSNGAMSLQESIETYSAP